MKLLIVRHGDPDYSIDSLTPTGWEEAELLSHRLCAMDVKAFYCSPLGRARDTAKPTLEKLNCQAEILPWLREFSPKVKRPDREVTWVAWDWLPQDWTKDPRFYDRDRWWENDAFQAANVREEAAWVAQGLDDCLFRHGYVREGNCYRAEAPNEDTIVLFCHFGIRMRTSWATCWASPPCLCGTASAPLPPPLPRHHGGTQAGDCQLRENAFRDTAPVRPRREPSFSGRFCETYSNEAQRHD